MKADRYITLNNNLKLPMLGFGTYLGDEREARVIKDAIEAGYRYFDTASFYGTEKMLGDAVESSGIARENFFLASKLWRSELGYENAKEAFYGTLERLKTDYLDLYFIHWPRKNTDDPDWKSRLTDTYAAMEELYMEKKIKAIGVSNFLPHHFEVFINEAKIKPMVNQLELHVGYMQPWAVQYCRDKNIAVQAWSPLARHRLNDEPIILEIARKYNVDVATLLLNFLTGQGISVIPRSKNPDRMRSNMNCFDLEISAEDVSYLSNLPQMGWSEEHPDYPCAFGDVKVPGI